MEHFYRAKNDKKNNNLNNVLRILVDNKTVKGDKEMKKKIIVLLSTITIVTLLGINVHAKLSLNEMDYLSKIELINNRIKYDLITDSKNRSGDLNYEFLKQMQSHQKIIIEFAQNEVNYSKNEEMKKIATHIIKERQGQLRQIEGILKELESQLTIDTIKEAAYYVCFEDIYNGLIEKIKLEKESDSIVATKGIDQDFILRMINHHEVTTEMINLIRTFTNSEEVKLFTEKIEEMNQKELDNLYKVASELDKELATPEEKNIGIQEENNETE